MIPGHTKIYKGVNVCSLAGVAILVVLVRAILFPLDTTQVDIEFDVDRWLETSRNLVNGKGYTLSTYQISDEPRPTAMRGPTVVYFFGAVIWLFGDNPWSIVIAQWLVDAVTAVVLFFIAMEIFRNRRVALLAALFYAFYLPGLIFTFRGWSEPLFTLLLALFTLATLRAARQPSFWRFALCGGLLALATLARPNMQFLPLVLLPLLWWALGRSWRHAVSRFAVFSIAFLAVLSPWLVRNYLVFNALIPGSTHSGVPLYEGNYALDQPDYLRQRSSEEANLALRKVLEDRFGPAPNHPDLATYARLKGLDELEVNKIASREVMEVVRAYPGRYALLSLVRLFRVWFHHRFVNFVILDGSLPKSWLVAAVNGVLLSLAGASFVWFRGAWLRPAALLLVLVAYSTLLYAATNAVGRYSVPLAPYVMVFAAHTIVQLFTKASRTSSVSAQA